MATTTYVALKTTTVGTATSSVTLTGFTASYKHLVIAARTKSTRASLDSLYVQFNGDVGSNYSEASLQGNGSTPSKGASTGNTRIYAGNAPGTDASASFAFSEIRIYDYNSSTNKNVMCIAGSKNSASNGTVDVIAGTWRNGTPVPITSITLSMGNANIQAGSEFILYGLVGADTRSKATGGAIYSDANYYYHVFQASGLFTPSQALTVDYLVIAGGGGGSNNEAGGGGAGGLRSTVTATGGLGTLESPLSLSNGTQYTVTVGGGGNNAGTVGVQGSSSVFSTITATGGGGGGNGGAVGGPGGSSGGGGAYGSNAAGTRTASPVQGFSGGIGSVINGGAGGGGGAGAVGVAGTASTAGNGGAGLELTAFATTTGTGVSNFYAGGGGGGAFTGSTQSTGGAGGGGAGGAGTPTTGSAGTVNTGGGGGGAGTGGAITGGAGGSGLVIVRYAK
jgi:hypothetical protein